MMSDECTPERDERESVKRSLVAMIAGRLDVCDAQRTLDTPPELGAAIDNLRGVIAHPEFLSIPVLLQCGKDALAYVEKVTHTTVRAEQLAS